MKNKGFTLIELLVVIAIIGILSSVVLASLNSARNKGADAAVKSNLANIRPQAEIYYDQFGSYVTANVTPAPCPSSGGLFGNATVIQQISAAKAAVGAASFNACSANTANGGSWAVVQQLKSDTTKGWCVDSRGIAKESTASAATQAGFTALVNSSGECI